jgi:hypothetical protein
MTIDEMVAALEHERRAAELDPVDPNDPLNGWPVHKLAAWVYNGAGADWLTAMLKCVGLRYEVLIDNAAELERRYLSHIAAILRKVAENAPSQVDDIIEREGEEEWWKRYGTVVVNQRKSRLMSQWLQDRERITGQSRDELVAFYGLEEWLGIADNGAGTGH